MKNYRWWYIVSSALFLVGCSQHTVSGAYLASSPTFVEFLQITQSSGGQLLGALNHYGFKSDGTVEHYTFNISGITDGHTITLVAKVNEPFSQPINLSGTIDHGEISVIQPSGVEVFEHSDAKAYQAAITEVTANAATARTTAHLQHLAEQSHKQIEQEDVAIADLAQRLNSYATEIQQKHDLHPFHAEQNKILDAARREVDVEHGFPAHSVQAYQAGVAVYQVSVRLYQANIPWSQFLTSAKGHLHQYDAEIAQSPCHTTPQPLHNCPQEIAAEQSYQASKKILEGELKEIASTIDANNATMKNIVKGADAYGK